ncbi:hypothetical protein Prudu_016240, partial [Prunus dulcis]
FLRKLYYSSLECPPSYDKLRFDPRTQKCRLLVTHDDYSMMSKLPRERVVTILGNPVEVAARFLGHLNLTSATQMTRRIRAKTKRLSTLDIWPWKYLVPWMRKTFLLGYAFFCAAWTHLTFLLGCRAGRKLRGSNNFQSKDPYNMEEIVMPSHKYINHPVAQEVVHNGATWRTCLLIAIYPEQKSLNLTRS